MQYLKSGPPQLQDMSSRLKDWFERNMMISMALDFNRAIWSSAVSSLEHTARYSMLLYYNCINVYGQTQALSNYSMLTDLSFGGFFT